MDLLEPTADVSMIEDGTTYSSLLYFSISHICLFFSAQETTIASESVITNAKQKRERLRTHGAADDYISLSLITRSDADQGPHPESRLVREDDELGEAEEGA
jgi:hypothetical protein